MTDTTTLECKVSVTGMEEMHCLIEALAENYSQLPESVQACISKLSDGFPPLIDVKYLADRFGREYDRSLLVSVPAIDAIESIDTIRKTVMCNVQPNQLDPYNTERVLRCEHRPPVFEFRYGDEVLVSWGEED